MNGPRVRGSGVLAGLSGHTMNIGAQHECLSGTSAIKLETSEYCWKLQFLWKEVSK